MMLCDDAPAGLMGVTPSTTEQPWRLKLMQETARISWHELQRFFAQGKVIWVQDRLDLVDVALWIAHDDAKRISLAMAHGDVVPVPDSQARHWLETQARVWAVVVKPWILVQEETGTIRKD